MLLIQILGLHKFFTGSFNNRVSTLDLNKTQNKYIFEIGKYLKQGSN